MTSETTMGAAPVLHTTYGLAEDRGACSEALEWAFEWLSERDRGPDDPVTLLEILDHAPPALALEWSLWALCAVPDDQVSDRDRLSRLLAADYAEHVLPRWTARCPDDDRPAVAIETARRYVVGDATRDELFAAAMAAAMAATAAAGEADGGAPVRVARAASFGGVPAAYAAPQAAEWAADFEACSDRGVVGYAAERDWQAARLRLYLTGAELPPVETTMGADDDE